MFWYDETFTALMAKLPFASMLQAVTGDVHPPLWYLIEWLIAHTVGASEFSLRLPSAFFGAGAVLMLHLLVTRLVGETEGRWAGGLMAVMPGQLYYSQEARMYSMMTFLLLLGAHAILDRKWLRVSICCALILFSQNLGAIYSAILAGWALWHSRGKALPKLALAGAAYIPQGLIALRQFSTINNGFWLSTPGNIGGALYYLFFTTFFVRLPEVFQLHAIATSLILTGASLYALRSHLKRVAPLLALAFLPPLVLYTASQVWRPVLLDRALLPAGAAVVGLWGIALSKIPARFRAPLAAIGLPILLVALVTYYLDPTEQRAKSDPMITIVENNWQPGDAVYHTHLASLISFDYYIPQFPAYILPESGDLAQSLSDATKSAMGIEQREYLPQALKQMGYKRLWLVSGDTVVTSQHELEAQQLFTTAYPVIRDWVIITNELETITLYLLRL